MIPIIKPTAAQACGICACSRFGVPWQSHHTRIKLRSPNHVLAFSLFVCFCSDQQMSQLSANDQSAQACVIRNAIVCRQMIKSHTKKEKTLAVLRRNFDFDQGAIDANKLNGP